MRAKLLVATDFSPRSDRALRRATLLAGQFDMAIHLAHVVDEDQPRYLIDSQVKAARAILNDYVRTLERIDGVEACAEVAVGDLFSAILEVADGIDPALIIIGPHRAKLRDAFIGTTAERTVAHSTYPVLVAAGIPSSPYMRALLAMDVDDASRAAARHIMKLPIFDQMDLVPMHVFDAPARGIMIRSMAAVEAIHHYVTSEQLAADERFRAMLDDLGVASARRLVQPVNGRAGRTVLEAARAIKAPLIVVGTSQRRGLKRLLLGSVAEEILADADRDVLVIPQTCVVEAVPAKGGTDCLAALRTG